MPLCKIQGGAFRTKLNTLQQQVLRFTASQQRFQQVIRKIPRSLIVTERFFTKHRKVGGELLKAEATPGKMGRNNSLEKNSETHQTKPELFPENAVQLNWNNMQQVGAGLTNIANTCFMNSVLQILAHTPALSELLCKESMVQKYQLKGFYVNAFKELIRPLFSQHYPITPKQFAQNLTKLKSSFTLGDQEDSHEYLRCLLDSMHEAQLAPFKPKPPKYLEDSTFIYQIFGGKMVNKISCVGVNYVSQREDTFFDIPLDIIRADSIYDALDDLIKTEVLDGDNKYRCPTNNQLVRALKSTKIKKAPKILTIVLKRFAFWGVSRKINRHISFPANLDISKYIDTSDKQSSEQQQNNVKEPANTRSNQESQYELYAVLVHQGMYSGSGHYIAYVKAPNGIWHEMNDAFVRMVSEQTVLNQRAYIILYKQKIQDHISNDTNHVATTKTPQKRQLNQSNSFQVNEQTRKVFKPDSVSSFQSNQNTEEPQALRNSLQDTIKQPQTEEQDFLRKKLDHFRQRNQQEGYQAKENHLENLIKHLPISPGRQLFDKYQEQLQNNPEDAGKILNGLQIDAFRNIQNKQNTDYLRSSERQGLKRNRGSLSIDARNDLMPYQATRQQQAYNINRAMSVNQKQAQKNSEQLAKGLAPRKQKYEMVTQNMSWMQLHGVKHENVTKPVDQGSRKSGWASLKLNIDDPQQGQISISENIDPFQVNRDIYSIQENMSNQISDSKDNSRNKQKIADKQNPTIQNSQQDQQNSLNTKHQPQDSNISQQSKLKQNQHVNKFESTNSHDDSTKSKTRGNQIKEMMKNDAQQEIMKQQREAQNKNIQISIIQTQKQPGSKILCQGSSVFSDINQNNNGSQIQTWQEADETQVQQLNDIKRQQATITAPRHTYDDWDETLDYGKQKKIKKDQNKF